MGRKSQREGAAILATGIVVAQVFAPSVVDGVLSMILFGAGVWFGMGETRHD